LTKVRHPLIARLLIAMLMVIGVAFSQGVDSVCMKCSIQESSGCKADQPASASGSGGRTESGNRSQQPKHCSCSCHHVCAAAVILVDDQKVVLFENTSQALETPVVFVPGGIVEGIERPPRA